MFDEIFGGSFWVKKDKTRNESLCLDNSLKTSIVLHGESVNK